MNRKIILRKIGKFYHAFDEDAVILSYLFGYKYAHKKCGFPENALDKVKETLEQYSIFYAIVDEEEYVFDDGVNEYDKVLEKAMKEVQLNELKDKLKERISNFDFEKLEQLNSFMDKLGMEEEKNIKIGKLF